MSCQRHESVGLTSKSLSAIITYSSEGWVHPLDFISCQRGRLFSWNKSWGISLLFFFRKYWIRRLSFERNQTKEALFLLIPGHQYPSDKLGSTPGFRNYRCSTSFQYIAGETWFCYAYSTSLTAPLLFRDLKWPSITTVSRETTWKHGKKWILRTGTNRLLGCCVLLSLLIQWSCWKVDTYLAQLR